MDSWDKLRELAVAVLGLFPCPLPGLQTPALLHQRVRLWLMQLSGTAWWHGAPLLLARALS